MPGKKLLQWHERMGQPRTGHKCMLTGELEVKKDEIIKKLEMGKSTPPAASTKISGRPVRSSDTDQKLVQSEEHAEQNSAQEQVVQGQLKHWLNDTVHIGMGRKQCRRTDGKNWQCPERAVSGTTYCGNHQYRMKQAVETKGVLRTPLLKDKGETNERHIEGYEEVEDQNTEHGNLID
ncbi:unnamed protein product [Sphagnum jensenii]|uniref:WRC domain-containing protein n=1 Tax=Sphagnum jensenii TaxID=128206 RepID=A0ABP0XEN6_9BRYO